MDKLIQEIVQLNFWFLLIQNKEDSIEVKVFEESVWLTQNYDCTTFLIKVEQLLQTFKNIFKSEELDEENQYVGNSDIWK